ncbi:hypothetical protein CSPX01_02544 [Colletotrichum filicis]|nr:hypothetical protein CSPX01_02544 [Colletotrichum filicis]
MNTKHQSSTRNWVLTHPSYRLLRTSDEWAAGAPARLRVLTTSRQVFTPSTYSRVVPQNRPSCELTQPRTTRRDLQLEVSSRVAIPTS